MRERLRIHVALQRLAVIPALAEHAEHAVALAQPLRDGVGGRLRAFFDGDAKRNVCGGLVGLRAGHGYFPTGPRYLSSQTSDSRITSLGGGIWPESNTM